MNENDDQEEAADQIRMEEEDEDESEGEQVRKLKFLWNDFVYTSMHCNYPVRHTYVPR